MDFCRCGHLHFMRCRRCNCRHFAEATTTSWNPGKDSYRYEAVQAVRGDGAL